MDAKEACAIYNKIHSLLIEYEITTVDEKKEALLKEALKQSCLFLSMIDARILDQARDFVQNVGSHKGMGHDDFEQFLSAEAKLFDLAGLETEPADQLLGLIRDSDGELKGNDVKEAARVLQQLRRDVCDKYNATIGAEAKLNLRTRIFFGVGGSLIMILNVIFRSDIGDAVSDWSVAFGTEVLFKAAETAQASFA